jgi:transcriptional regulator with XRE-family HTH domain
MDNDDLSLGKYIRQLREGKRLSLLELSNRSTVAYAHLSRIENESTIPNPETIVKIAHELDGDLTLMLQKANKLPRVILDRLMERDKAVKLQTLRRAIPGESDDSPGGTDESSVRAIESAELTEQEVTQLREAIEGLVSLRPHARRAVIQLLSVLHDDEGNGEPG